MSDALETNEVAGCPDCGSQEVVSKAAAWDALTSIPPKAEKELNELRLLRAAVFDLLSYDHMQDNTEGTVTVAVPLRLLSALARNPQVDPNGTISKLIRRTL